MNSFGSSRVLRAACALVVALLGESVAAQSFVLQGEPGFDALVRARRTESDVCAVGVSFDSGVDVDRDGVLDDDEQTSSRDVCADLGFFTCVDDVCASPFPIAAPAITIGDLGVVLAQPSRTIAIPADAPTLAAAFALLDGLSLTGDVTVQLADGVHNEPAAVVVTHPDASRITIRGGVSSVVRFTGTSGIIVRGTQLKQIATVTIEGNDSPNTVGVAADARGGVTVAADVEVNDFDAAIAARGHSRVFAFGATTRSNGVGFVAEETSLLRADDASAIDNADGFLARSNSLIAAPRCSATDNERGVIVADGSTGVFDNCVIRDNAIAGASALGLGFVSVLSATHSGNGTDLVANGNAVINGGGAGPTRSCGDQSLCP